MSVRLRYDGSATRNSAGSVKSQGHGLNHQLDTHEKGCFLLAMHLLLYDYTPTWARPRYLSDRHTNGNISAKIDFKDRP